MIRTGVRLAACAALGVASLVGLAHAAATGDTDLKVYDLPDKSASVLLPPDWRVVQSGAAYVRARGPNGELALFGAIVPAQGSQAANQMVLSQPYSADNKDKFIASTNFLLQHVGMQAVPIQILSEKVLKEPDAFGRCSNFTALFGPKGGIAGEADFCSLPVSSSGSYQNFFKLVAVRANRAKAERPMLEKMLASYALNGNVFKRSQAATSALAAGPGPAGMAGVPNSAMSAALVNAQARALQSATINGQVGSLMSASNFDHAILRNETPVYLENGGDEPVFWVGGD